MYLPRVHCCWGCVWVCVPSGIRSPVQLQHFTHLTFWGSSEVLHAPTLPTVSDSPHVQHMKCWTTSSVTTITEQWWKPSHSKNDWFYWDRGGEWTAYIGTGLMDWFINAVVRLGRNWCGLVLIHVELACRLMFGAWRPGDMWRLWGYYHLRCF